MKKQKNKSKLSELVDKIKEDKVSFSVYAIIRLIVILILVRAVLRGEWESVFVCVLTLILLLLPPFIEKGLSLELPTGLEITAFLFVFCAEILGELGADEVLLANCIDYMCPDLMGPVIKVNKFLHSSAGKASREKLKNPPVYKPKRAKRPGLMERMMNASQQANTNQK